MTPNEAQKPPEKRESVEFGGEAPQAPALVPEDEACSPEEYRQRQAERQHQEGLPPAASPMPQERTIE